MKKEIEISEENASRITTAVIVEEDWSLRHVPTRIEVINGKHVVHVNSLTNSVYMFISNYVTFDDIVGRWSQKSIDDLASRKILSGVGEDKFEPERNISRAEFVTAIVKAVGFKVEADDMPFIDISSEMWYSDFVSVAYSNGLISGYGDNTFRPNDVITREEAMVIVSKALKYTNLDTEANQSVLRSYSDYEAIHTWARDSIATLLELNIVSGRGNNSLAIRENISREEAVALIRKILQVSDLIQ